MNTHMVPGSPTPSSFVTFRLARLQNTLNAQATFILKSKAGLSLVEWRLIQSLRMFENASLTELSEHVQMDKGQLSRKISKMVEKGLLRVEKDKHDQRVQHLHLTAKAQRLSDQLMPTMEARQAVLIGNVVDDDLAAFYRVLEKIEEAAKIRDIA